MRTPVLLGGLAGGDSRLIALNKKSGGIRHIAIGFTLRRLVSECASFFGVGQLANYFNPEQLGVVTAGGCEAAVHAGFYSPCLPTMLW